MHTEKLFHKLKQYIDQTSSTLLIKLLINGLKVDMNYQKGQLQKITMMDQEHLGLDVTHVVRASVDVPEKIPFTGFVNVRANVIHTFSDFEKMNMKGEYLDHKDLTKNLIVRQMDGEQNKFRVIVSSIVDINDYDSESILTEMERLAFLLNQGFHVVYHERLENNYEEIRRYYNTFREYHRKEIGYSISGLQILSPNSHGFKEGLILPFSSDKAVLTVEDCYPEVDSTGKINPILKIKATDMAGKRYFSLRLPPNYSMIKSMDIRIGDQVLMQDVYTIIGVEKEKRTGVEISITKPINCPKCGAKLKSEAEQLYCMNLDCKMKPGSGNYQKKGIEGKTIVITGTLSIRRYEFRKLIEQSGGILAGVVTNQTDFLLIGEKGIGTVKYRKAQSLKVPIVTEEQFRLMIDKEKDQ